MAQEATKQKEEYLNPLPARSMAVKFKLILKTVNSCVQLSVMVTRSYTRGLSIGTETLKIYETRRGGGFRIGCCGILPRTQGSSSRYF